MQSTECNWDQHDLIVLPPQATLTAGNRESNELTDLSQDLLFRSFDNADVNANLDWILESSCSEYYQPDLFPMNTTNGHAGLSPQSLLASTSQTTVEVVIPSAVSDDLGEGLLVPQPQDALDHGDPWPCERARPPLKHIVLPSLGSTGRETAAEHGRYYSITPITDQTWQALRKCLRLPFQHNTLQTINLDNFPVAWKLDQCIDLYFAHFHPISSIIHQPTFDPGKDLVVTLAMICIGASYTEFSESEAFSTVFSDLIRRLLVFMAEHDHRFVRTRSYVVAQLLQAIHGYSSGNERLFELAESYRNSVIYHSKCMGLFRSENVNSSPSGTSVKECWQHYIHAESSRRLAWAVFQYDATTAYFLNTRPLLNHADLNLDLPGSAEMWKAENAEVWASLHPWSKQAPRTSPLRPKLDLFFDGSPNPADTFDNEEHLSIIVLMLLRMLWTLKEVRSYHVHETAIPHVYETGRWNLLLAIDKLRVPIMAVTDDYTRSEMTHLVHRTGLVHVAHIYGAGDLMNWLYPYLRNDLERETIKIRMREWAAEDPRRMREVTYHSAQLLNLVRHYPSQVALQSYLIFHAGVILSCMSFLLLESHAPLHGPSFQIEELAAGTEELAQQMKWIEDGATLNISLTGVPMLCCSAGRQQILSQTALLLKRHKTWGISHKLGKVVLALSKRDA
ncbi:hypothetical protein NX059_007941 [Plenodomus lindquistii]|nr:hypothetical protein NX059_007941 [Plenodomus lindquistii]